MRKSTGVIIEALGRLGAEAVSNGRNDILAAGRKVSGNAYYKGSRACLHHGTILYDADINRMEKVLAPQKGKLARNRVASVRSRVVNMKEIVPDVTLLDIKAALRTSFETEFGYCEDGGVIRIDDGMLSAKINQYSDDRWNLEGRAVSYHAYEL